MVVEEGVDLNDEAIRAPEEVDLPAAKLDVGLRERPAVAVTESEEVFLEVAAGAAALGAFEANAFEVRLAAGSAEEVRGDRAVEVVGRALDGGERDVVAGEGGAGRPAPPRDLPGWGWGGVWG